MSWKFYGRQRTNWTGGRNTSYYVGKSNKMVAFLDLLKVTAVDDFILFQVKSKLSTVFFAFVLPHLVSY
jgi:hypothetical protein